MNWPTNGIYWKKIFENVWIQPAAGDAGGSLGAALCAYYLFKKNKRIIDKNDSMRFILGPEFKATYIKKSYQILALRIFMKKKIK